MMPKVTTAYRFNLKIFKVSRIFAAKSSTYFVTGKPCVQEPCDSITYHPAMLLVAQMSNVFSAVLWSMFMFLQIIARHARCAWAIALLGDVAAQLSVLSNGVMSKNLARNAVDLCEMSDALLKSLTDRRSYAEQLQQQRQQHRGSSEPSPVGADVYGSTWLQLHRAEPIQASKPFFHSKYAAAAAAAAGAGDLDREASIPVPARFNGCSRDGFLFEELVLLAGVQPPPHVLDVERLLMWMPVAAADADAVADASTDTDVATSASIEADKNKSEDSSQKQQQQEEESKSRGSLRLRYASLRRGANGVSSSSISRFPIINHHVTCLLKLLRTGTIGWQAFTASVWQLGRLLESGLEKMPPLCVCSDMYVICRSRDEYM
jgi:hypothetical protein